MTIFTATQRAFLWEAAKKYEVLRRWDTGNNTELRMTQMDNGHYYVVMWDLDASEPLPYAKSFKKMSDAIRYAEKIAKKTQGASK
jgi:hypothetical protein